MIERDGVVCWTKDWFPEAFAGGIFKGLADWNMLNLLQPDLTWRTINRKLLAHVQADLYREDYIAVWQGRMLLREAAETLTPTQFLELWMQGNCEDGACWSLIEDTFNIGANAELLEKVPRQKLVPCKSPVVGWEGNVLTVNFGK